MGIPIGIVLSSSEWIIPAMLLLIVAWVKFNTPPTNRSGTTFALFFSGVIFYYALILALWLGLGEWNWFQQGCRRFSITARSHFRSAHYSCRVAISPSGSD